MNIALFALFALPAFTFHWYEGELPPFTGVAMKVTADPGQKGLADAVIEIPAGRLAFTARVTAPELAGFPNGHNTIEVRVQVIASPLSGR